ncbi:uroporphyrinogen-III synthase [Jannaschia aquimarina]|uniref:Uroporphyrinogen-III synthase n=1 Tax=Jannaschia aquimarina TaxID=935700 RepID=A0A0D1EET7_9RHOB|nr:uroporphyrinogen-III synthase [Jannaschia aquimarina]KIT15396.1 uroporphyrinogen-III synthase [Jannaschia aquimarina]SNT22917.1 uroporphyrinogen-III synthase [Jannaschia aquimarina]
MSTPPVLLTRPLAQSEAFAARLGMDCVISPLLEIVFTGRAPEAEALIATSANGVAAWIAAGGATGLPVWCVGPGTARAAREAGLRVVGMSRNATYLAEDMPDGQPPLTHVRGAHVATDLAGALRVRGMQVAEAVLYEAQARPLSDAARTLARAGPVVVPVFSPRSARLLGNEWPADALSNLRAVAISEAAAEGLPVSPAAIADRPDGEAMVSAVLGTIGG